MSHYSRTLKVTWADILWGKSCGLRRGFAQQRMHTLEEGSKAVLSEQSETEKGVLVHRKMKVWHKADTARLGSARRGSARPGKVRHGTARLGTARLLPARHESGVTVSPRRDRPRILCRLAMISLATPRHAAPRQPRHAPPRHASPRLAKRADRKNEGGSPQLTSPRRCRWWAPASARSWPRGAPRG